MRRSIYTEIENRKDIIEFLQSNESIDRLFDLPTLIDKERVELYKQLYDGIGKTAIYELPLANKNKLYIKLEYSNNMGNNHYSRFWLPYLFLAETLGLISPNNDEILEVSSGSSGIALSMACEKLGYKLSIIVPASLPKERLIPMGNTNTTIIKVDGYIDTCVEKLRDMLQQEKLRYFAANHAEEKADIITLIFSRIAKEFLQEKKIVPDYTILAVGNGSSAEAVASVFQNTPIPHNHKSWMIGFHPDFSQGQAQPVLGLLPERVKFRHVEALNKLVDDIEFTNSYGVERLKNQYHYDATINEFGESSLYAVGIANRLSKRVANKTFFSIAYDHRNRYS